MTPEGKVVEGEYLTHVHLTIADVVRRGTKQTKFGERQKVQDEKKKERQQKIRIKNARARVQEEGEEDKQEEEETQEQLLDEPEEPRGWADNLWLRIAEALGDDYNPVLTLHQQVWVIDEASDGSPAVYQGNAMRTKASWTVDGVSEWELEFRGEKNRTRYPSWSIFIHRKDAVTVLKLLSPRRN